MVLSPVKDLQVLVNPLLLQQLTASAPPSKQYFADILHISAD
jgi:hypothetical protein